MIKLLVYRCNLNYLLGSFSALEYSNNNLITTELPELFDNFLKSYDIKVLCGYRWHRMICILKIIRDVLIDVLARLPHEKYQK